MRDHYFKGNAMIKKQTASGLSVALNKTIYSSQMSEPIIDQSAKLEFKIKIANTLEERDAVFKLGYQTYLTKGYIKKNAEERLICDYDFNPETVILIVQDKQKNIAGSVTLVFDGSMVLPAKKVYGKELNEIKKLSNRTAEFCRFVISPDFRHSKEILVLLFNYAAIYINSVKKYDGIAIEVTPRHKNYYKALLHFDEVGSEKCCPQVQNTVGVLLYLPASRYQEAIKQKAEMPNADKKDRSLYPYFLSLEQESLVAYYLKKQAKPMTAEEKMYFGFSESGINFAVTV